MTDIFKKTCSECGNQRDLIAFYRNRNLPSGYEARCKPCFNANRAIYAGTLKRDSKKCSSCLEVKCLDDFYKSKETRDGRGGYCKVCTKEKYKIYRASNPKVALLNRISAKISKESKDPEERRRLSREYYRKNKDKITQQRMEKRKSEKM